VLALYARNCEVPGIHWLLCADVWLQHKRLLADADRDAMR
jgi:hypothetical protein